MTSQEKTANPVPVLLVIGQGYVGLPLSVRAASVGYSVIGYDVNKERVERLRNAQSFVEDISNADLNVALESGHFRPTAEITDRDSFDFAVITVPTPLHDGAPDLSFVEQAGRVVGPLISRGSTVILESTTYPGTTEEFLGPILKTTSGLIPGIDFYLGYSPERIDPGNQLWDLRHTPKIVSGIDEASLQKITDFYETIVEKTIPVSTPKVAELTKLLENTFRHVNIALVNELAMFASDLGVDVWEAIDAASTKPFGFMPFRPGPGVGGHCLPVDPSYLSWKVKQTLGTPFRFIELANDINDHMPDYVARRASHLLNRLRRPVNGSRILVLGLAYKRNTGDARESPAPVLCERLVNLGADVRAADPHVDPSAIPPMVSPAELTEAELAGADLVIVTTDHDRFDWDLVLAHSTQILDTRHRLPPAAHVEFL